MKTQKGLFFMIAFCCASFSFAQKSPFKLKPLKFNTVQKFSVQHSAPESNAVGFIALQSDHQPAVFDPQVHYPAFFCRMELRSVKQFGIWIKVHAGDYDSYSRPFTLH